MASYKGKVRVAYKHYVVHPDTVNAAHHAACAAGLQGKFQEFSTKWWVDGYGKARQTRDDKYYSEENVLAIAASVGVDIAKLKADMADACVQRIQQDMAELSKFGVSGTPAFFVNGYFTWFQGPDSLRELIDRELAVVEKSGVPAAEYYEKVVVGQGSSRFVSKAAAKKKANK